MPKYPPNILLLVAEDTGRHHGCYGDDCALTPAIDALAAEGCRYENAFSTAPVCAPSRSALVTGRTAFSIGSHHMRSTLRHPPKLFTEALREAGYYVNWANKTDFNFDPPPAFADATHEWFTDLAEDRLPDQPCFLYHNFGCTHESRIWPERWEVEIKPHLAPAERCDPDGVTVPAYLPDCPEVRADIARYMDSLSVQDKQVAAALKALDRSGRADNSVVLYLSDHGRGLPREKRWLYEAGIHLPLIIRAPGLIEPGSENHELISWLDIAPTLLHLAGAEPLAEAQGRIFLGSEKDDAPDYVFAGRDRMDEVFDRVRAARSQRFLYLRNDFPALPYASRLQYMEKQATTQVLRSWNAEGRLDPSEALWMAERKPSEELYDCQTDPDNIYNLVEDDAYSGILATHRAALDDYLGRRGDLGQLPERQLIEEGLVLNRIPEYDERREALPEAQRIGPKWAPIEMPET
jgi:N-sulfoglucosamine sulfohydrolase